MSSLTVPVICLGIWLVTWLVSRRINQMPWFMSLVVNVVGCSCFTAAIMNMWQPATAPEQTTQTAASDDIAPPTKVSDVPPPQEVPPKAPEKAEVTTLGSDIIASIHWQEGGQTVSFPKLPPRQNWVVRYRNDTGNDLQARVLGQTYNSAPIKLYNVSVFIEDSVENRALSRWTRVPPTPPDSD